MTSKKRSQHKSDDATPAKKRARCYTANEDEALIEVIFCLKFILVLGLLSSQRCY